MLFTVECATCAKRMSVPEELYEKRVRGRAALLACRGCGSKIRLDGTAGVGLGLSLVAAVVRLHGFTLDFDESWPGCRAVIQTKVG